MADFLDSEAEESDDEELSTTEKKKLKRQRALDSDEDEEDEDDEEKLKEELKDLIDDNPIEEEESEGEDSDGSRNSKKRKKSDDELSDRLEDDDYDLLEENLGHKIQRKKKFKRLRRLEDESGDEEEQHVEGEDREAIANELFDGSDNEGEGVDRVERLDSEMVEEEEEGEYSDDDGFIVDDEGRSISEKRKKKKPIFSDAALQEAQDIFGVDFDFEEFDKYGDEYEEEEEDEYDEEEVGEEESRRRKEKKKARKTAKKSIFEIYEPSELKRGHFTDLDNEIRTTDMPERMQLRDIPVTPVTEDELDEQAEWIFKQAFTKGTISMQEGQSGMDRERLRRGTQTVTKIKKALDFMLNQNFEVPFIAFYRKEYVLPELTTNELWRVYKFNEKWCQLRNRKKNLLVLFEKMRDYQLQQLTENLDNPLPANARILKDEDINRLKSVQTMEELRDVHSHFLLYYAQDIPTMLEASRKKEREEKRENRRRKRAEAIANGEELEGEDEATEEDEAEDAAPEETIKQANRSGPYAMCRKAGIDALAKRFGLTPAQFGENLRDNYQRHEVEQEAVEPLELAKEYVSRQFSTPEEVLRAAKFVVGTQLAREPLVRKCVREAYFESAKIKVRPTKKGQKEIDENHGCYGMKYLTGKPVRELENDQFLKLCMAEDDKLLTIEFDERIPGLASTSYLEEVKQLYYRDEFSRSVQDWNGLRVDCVELAIKNMLFPEMRKELKMKLLQEAKEYVLKVCCRKLYNWLKVAPYKPELTDVDDDDWDLSKGLRVLGIAYVPDFSQAAFAAVVAGDGDCTEYLRLPHLLKRKNSFYKEEAQLKEADLQSLKNLIMARKPHVVVIGGESRDALMIQQDVQQICAALAEDEDFIKIDVQILDNELSKVYANSKKSEADFRDYPLLLRQAISLARRMQDPLMEFSQLCTADEEILCLRYHTFQDQVSREELLEGLNLEFVNRTNEVGVDVNLAVLQPYTSNLVQFVCGLGPRKATALLKTLKQNNQRLENRTQLVTLCHMGPKVFINCAGFIKIDTNSLGDSTEAYVEVLDGSRVHPETYEWARKMAVDALEYDDEEANPAGALEEILEAPERLKDLDLDAFAEELERQGFGNKSITLYDIRAELNHRYKDLRTTYKPPNAEEMFDMLTKETPETFYIGKMVLASVIGITHKKPKGEQLDQANPVRNEDSGLWQCPFCLKNDFPELSEVWNHFDAGSCPGQATGVRLRLDNGVSGYIPVRNLSDKHVANPAERVQPGQTIHARITKIEVEKFAVECTSRTSDLVDKAGDWRPPKDRFYDMEGETADKRAEEEKKRHKARQQYIKRVIVHPSFHNVGYAEAEKLMATMEQGEAIIRPSSKGANHLTVTWKVTDNILSHIDIREEGKENAFSLGQSLWIDNESFEDLDEIIARHINPMAGHVRDILAFKNYRDFDGGKRELAEEALRDEKRKNANKIHYFISASKSHPGRFMLSYLPRQRSRHEFITVTPDGFKFRAQLFDSLAHLFKWFKEHFRDPIPGTPRTPGNTRTPHHSTTNQAPNTNLSESIQRVVQTIPNHMFQSLSQVAATPHYPSTPGQYHFANTPYTPSGQTPFMTPYNTSATPRYAPHTPGPYHGHGTTTPHHQQSHHHGGGGRMGPPPSSHAGKRYGGSRGGRGGGMDWQRAAEAWAKDRGPSQHRRGTPRSEHYATPRGSFGTPMTNTSPHSMVESSLGDGTPLYDEN